ncbi:MAG TPA: hypothetical protein VMR51_00250 [Patescibacteria group bacterium]|nr:hypothetical protein [Patescibacteria group bacterium]
MRMGHGASPEFGFNDDLEDIEKNITDNISLLEQFWQKNYIALTKFEERIAFYEVARSEESERSKILQELAEARQDTRQMFIYDTKLLLALVCKYNFDEFLCLDEALARKQNYAFKHYIFYDLKEEMRTKKGYEYVNTVGFILRPKTETANHNDEMHIRFVVPGHLILDEDVQEDEVLDWIESIQDVYVEYTRDSDKGLETETNIVSAEGLQSYPLPELLGTKHIDDLNNPLKRQQADFKEIKKLEELYRSLKNMKPVSYYKTVFDSE